LIGDALYAIQAISREDSADRGVDRKRKRA